MADRDRSTPPTSIAASVVAAERRAVLNRRLRAAFIEGAERDSLRRLGRGLTAEEFERERRRYPGDVQRIDLTVE